VTVYNASASTAALNPNNVSTTPKLQLLFGASTAVPSYDVGAGPVNSASNDLA